MTETHITLDRRPAVLFLCVHNGAGPRWRSAGSTTSPVTGPCMVRRFRPAAEVNPAAVAAMAEVGIDISGEFPKPWTDEIVRAADAVVTMGCGDACRCSRADYLDWDLDDPAGQGVEAVRPIRDEIKQRVVALLADLGVPNQLNRGRRIARNSRVPVGAHRQRDRVLHHGLDAAADVLGESAPTHRRPRGRGRPAHRGSRSPGARRRCGGHGTSPTTA